MMGTPTKYSVVIATYNRAADLRGTLASLALMSAGAAWEVIVVDNNSTDDTAAVVRDAAGSFPAGLTYVHEPVQGRSAALNAGIAVARGDVVVTTDDDVRVEPDWLTHAGDALERLQCGYVGGRVLPIWGGPRPHWLSERPGPHWAVVALLDYGPTPIELTVRMPLGVNMAFRREVFDIVGGWDPRVGRRAGTLLGQEVREWCIRARRAGVRGYYVPEMVVRHIIPAERLNKQYFRRWSYWRGISRGLLYQQQGLDMESPQETRIDFSRVAHIAGIPRYLFRVLLRHGRACAGATLRGDAVAAFEHEMWLWMFAGIARQRWRDRGTPFPWAAERPVLERSSTAQMPEDGRREHPAAGHEAAGDESMDATVETRAMAPTGAQPTVSIITPAFNAERFIGLTIESVLRQTFDDFELLVVDDGSTDDTAAIVRTYARRDARVRLLSQPNAGVSAARNAAFAHGTGRFFALLDSDDVWLPGYLEEQLAILAARPDIAILSANAINVGGPADGDPLLPVSSTGRLRQVPLLTLVHIEDAVPVLTVLRREVIDAIGPFDTALTRSEDYDLWLRAAAAGFPIVVNPKPLAFYRRRPDSASADEVLMLRAIRQPLMKLRAASADRPEVTAAVDRQLARFTERALVAAARRALIAGDMDEVATHLRALTHITGALRYQLGCWLAGTAPATLRWAYSCKRTVRQIARRRRRHDRAAYAALASPSRSAAAERCHVD
jgi:glycosyltransferase involved in cell wall biosynthesis